MVVAFLWWTSSWWLSLLVIVWVVASSGELRERVVCDGFELDLCLRRVVVSSGDCCCAAVVRAPGAFPLGAKS